MVGLLIFLIIVSLGVNGYFMYKEYFQDNDEDTKEETPEDKPATSSSFPIIGLVYDSGLSTLTDKNKPDADFQITFLAKDFSRINPDGYYLLGDEVDSSYWGKCVGVDGDIPEAWTTAKQIQDNYSRSAITVTDIAVLDYSLCLPGFTRMDKASDLEALGKTEMNVTGNITHQKRIVPDISYDYLVNMPEGFEDIYSPSGITQTVTSYAAQPASFAQLVKMEQGLTVNSTITFYVVQGYAESSFFEVFDIVQK